MGRAAVAIVLTEAERQELEGLARRRRTAQGLARRAQIVLLSAESLPNKDIAARLEADPETVGVWRRRFAERGIDGLYDEPRPGAPRQIGDDEIAEMVRRTLEETPSNATHWSLRSMARAVALDHSPHLEGVRSPAASQRDVQALQRSLFRREGARHRRALHGAAGARAGAVRGREEPDPGP